MTSMLHEDVLDDLRRRGWTRLVVYDITGIAPTFWFVALDGREPTRAQLDREGIEAERPGRARGVVIVMWRPHPHGGEACATTAISITEVMYAHDPRGLIAARVQHTAEQGERELIMKAMN